MNQQWLHSHWHCLPQKIQTNLLSFNVITYFDPHEQCQASSELIQYTYPDASSLLSTSHHCHPRNLIVIISLLSSCNHLIIVIISSLFYHHLVLVLSSSSSSSSLHRLPHLIIVTQDVDEIIFTDGRATGIKVGNQMAKANIVFGDPSYFFVDMVKPTGKIVPCICLLNLYPITHMNDYESVKIIIPGAQVAHHNDIFVCSLEHQLQVLAPGIYVAIVSTFMEEVDPDKNLVACLRLLGPILKRFTSVTTTMNQSRMAVPITAIFPRHLMPHCTLRVTVMTSCHSTREWLEKIWTWISMPTLLRVITKKKRVSVSVEMFGRQGLNDRRTMLALAMRR